MEKVKNVSKTVSKSSKSDYELVMDEIKKLIPGQPPGFNIRVAQRLIKDMENPPQLISMRNHVSYVRNGQRKDWRVLEAMDNELEDARKLRDKMLKKHSPEIRFQKVD